MLYGRNKQDLPEKAIMYTYKAFKTIGTKLLRVDILYTIIIEFKGHVFNPLRAKQFSKMHIFDQRNFLCISNIKQRYGAFHF